MVGKATPWVGPFVLALAALIVVLTTPFAVCVCPAVAANGGGGEDQDCASQCFAVCCHPPPAVPVAIGAAPLAEDPTGWLALAEARRLHPAHAVPPLRPPRA